MMLLLCLHLMEKSGHWTEWLHVLDVGYLHWYSQVQIKKLQMLHMSGGKESADQDPQNLN